MVRFFNVAKQLNKKGIFYMEKGTIVKIRFRRYFKEQRLWVFVGKVLESKDGWIKIHGKRF